MKIVRLFLLAAIISGAIAAEDDWRKEARDFLAEQDFAPIEVKPGTRFQTDLSRERWQWQQRVLLPVFEKHLEKWPALAERARSFVKQALMAQIKHPDVDRARPPEMLENEGLELEKAGVDDPLVLFATAWAAWEWREGYMDAIARLHKAVRLKPLKDYPVVLTLMLRKLIDEIEEDRNGDEPTHRDEYFKAGIKAANDLASYSAADDEILMEDVRHVFYHMQVEKHRDEMVRLAASPQATPWLHEMMQGLLHSALGWASRGGGYAGTVTKEGWKGFEEHLPIAKAHFVKAWELRPDRAYPAVKMIDLGKAGFGETRATTRQWFDRAIGAQFDCALAYYEYVWTLRPRWGGSVGSIKALLLACALSDRPDTEVAEVVLQLVDFVKSDSDAPDDRAVLQTPILKEALLHTARRLAEEPTRIWERPWRHADLGVYAWKAANYAMADDILRQVPVPFPRQTRRKLHLTGNEVEVRGQSAIYAIGMEEEWATAQDAYARRNVPQAMLAYQDIARRFQGEPPGMLLERIAACKFETAFKTGGWVKMSADPDLAQWHHLSGLWSGSTDGTLILRGHDGQAFLLHNGRVGGDFEMRGEYTMGGRNPYQGMGVLLGYRNLGNGEHFLACSQWGSPADGAIASLLRDFAQTNAPQLILRQDDRTWRFNLLCRDGRVTYRLNHQDVLVDYVDRDDEGEVFAFFEDDRIGFHQTFAAFGSTTSIRNLEIRKLVTGKNSQRSDVAGLHEVMQLEIADRVAEAKREKKNAEADKIEAFGKMIQAAGGEPALLPAVTLEERTLHSLLRGYRQSVATRLALAGKPITNPPEEQLLEGTNTVKWQTASGDWTLKDGVLTGDGDSSIGYDFHRAPPFRIDFEITVLDGMRPRLVMGKIKFANEGYKTTFGLYPQPKGAPLFTYERKKRYQITIKAAKDKTELFVDGAKACDGPKIEGVVEVLQFRAGDDYSKGKAEFRNILLSPLP